MKQNNMSSVQAPSRWRAGWLRFTQKRYANTVLALLGTFIGTLLIVGGKSFYDSHFGPRTGYSIVGLNYLERPIFSFSVDNVWGGNMFAGKSGGGGGATCCLSISHDATTVKVKWILSYTGEQKKQGYQEEHREAIVPLPPITNDTDKYIGVHFLPGNEVVLTLSDWIPDPIQPIQEIHYDFSK